MLLFLDTFLFRINTEISCLYLKTKPDSLENAFKTSLDFRIGLLNVTAQESLNHSPENSKIYKTLRNLTIRNISLRISCADRQFGVLFCKGK
jgi:hypothetical protein